MWVGAEQVSAGDIPAFQRNPAAPPVGSQCRTKTWTAIPQNTGAVVLDLPSAWRDKLVSNRTSPSDSEDPEPPFPSWVEACRDPYFMINPLAISSYSVPPTMLPPLCPYRYAHCTNGLLYKVKLLSTLLKVLLDKVISTHPELSTSGQFLLEEMVNHPALESLSHSFCRDILRAQLVT
jgi:hypothetical protein